MTAAEGSRVAKNVLAVGSGKGGVGKSTVALNLAIALAETGFEVGLLDADVHGPNIPLLVNLARKVPARSWTLWRNPELGEHRIEPVVEHGVRIVSTGFIVAEDQPLTWDAGLVSVLVRQLVVEVEWGELDHLVVDLPPGTGHVQQELVKQLPLTGAILVVTPQDVAHLDARKALVMFRDGGVPVLGAVENMSGMVCPHCSEPIDVFHPVTDDRSIWARGVERLGEVPLDPEVSRAGDAGRPILVAAPDSPRAWAFRGVANRIVQRTEARSGR